jgi:hypothetical protein
MGIKRYTAINDNTITNAFESNLVTRGTGSNMGLADSLEVFSIYAQATSASSELSRMLLKFPVLSSDATTTIQADRTAGTIPASGSVDFYLRCYNVKHTSTLPRNFTLVVSPVSQSWQEGNGLDMEEYSDLTYGGTGSNWINAAAQTTWTNNNGTTLTGGSYLSASWNGSPQATYNEFNYKQTFGETGVGDLDIKITGLVEKWIAGDYSNHGVGVMLTASQEDGKQSYYTKKFSARSSEFFFSHPVIEARWNSSRKDQRGSFYISSSNLNAADNLNTIYLYNYVRGQPKNLANVGTGPVYVNVYTSASGGEKLTATPNSPITGGYVDVGIYSASFALDTTASYAFDRWFSGSSGSAISSSGVKVYHTGTFMPKEFDSSNIYSIPRYVTAITNLESQYYNEGTARMRLFTRLKDWSPTIYTVASKAIENNIVEDAYFKVFRVVDEKDVITYGTGSLNHTKLSYDVTGSYFDLDMKMLESGYAYGIKFVYYINGAYQEQPETFKFRVIE